MSDSDEAETTPPKAGKQPKLDVVTVQNLLWEARAKWYNIGLELRLTEGDLDAIKSDNRDVDSCFRCMISKWLRKDNLKPTWAKIIEALMAPPVSYQQLASQLSSEVKIVESDSTVHEEGQSAPTLDDVQSHRDKSAILELSGLFPHAEKIKGLSDDERKKLEEKLFLESQQIMLKFLALRNKFFDSIESRQVSLKNLVRYLKGLKAFKLPTLANPQEPALKDVLDKIASIEDVKDIIEDHSSFFDYTFVEYMINTIGTQQDSSNLEKYIKDFKQYAERRVYFCPSKFITDTASTKESECKLYVKLDSAYDEYDLSGMKRFQLRLAELLNAAYEVLRLCSIEKGCFKLIFLIPRFLKDILFPLSSEQELELKKMNVLELKCGDYSMSSKSGARGSAPGDDDSDSDDDDDDDDDDGDFSLSASIHTGITERIPSKSNDKDKDSAVGTSLVTGSTKGYTHSLVSTNLDLDEPLLELECTFDSSQSNDYDLLLRAAKTGDLAAVKNLIEEKRLNPEQLCNGSSALHYAAAGGSLNVLHYFIEEQECRHSLQGNLKQTPLHVAAQCGKLDVVHYLVDGQGVEPNQQDKYLRTAMHYACIGGNMDILKYLIKEVEKYVKIDDFINDRTKAGCGLLHLAAYNGCEEIVKYLILMLKCNPAVTGRKGRTALHEASINGHEHIVRFLCSECSCSETCDKFKSTPLHIASANGHLNLMKFFILEAHSDLMRRTSDNYTPLHLAALNGHVNIVEFLASDRLNCNLSILGFKQRNIFHLAAMCGHLPLVIYIASELKVNPFTIDRECKTPVEIAAINNNDHVVQFLHSYYLCDNASKGDLSYIQKYLGRFKCDPSTSTTDGNTALHCACASGHLPIVKYLVDELKCPTLKKNNSRYSPLHLAILSAHPEIVYFLTSDRKCDPNQRGLKHRTPLHLAADVGNLAIVTHLTLNLKCNPLATDKNGCIPVDFAERKGHVSVAEFLNRLTINAIILPAGNLPMFKSYIEDHKCDPNPSNEHGNTPLHIAAENGYLRTVKYLIETHNCDPSCSNVMGQTPLYLAAEAGHLNVVEYLTCDKKCDVNIASEFPLYPLCAAVREDHLHIVKYLIEKMNCVYIISGDEGIKLIHYACSTGSLKSAKYLIEGGYADPNSKDKHKTTPLYYASIAGHLNIMKYLVEEQKCNPYGNFSDDGDEDDNDVDSGEDDDIFKDDEDEYYEDEEDEDDENDEEDENGKGDKEDEDDIFKDNKGSVDDEDDEENKNDKGDEEDVEDEGDKDNENDGEDDNWYDDYIGTIRRTTPVHGAAFHGHLPMLEYLIDKCKCNPSVMNEDGQTPLHMASAGGHLECVRYLIEKQGCDPTLCYCLRYHTPLYEASKSGHLHIVEYLFKVSKQSGRQLKEILAYNRDSSGKTPLHAASESGHLHLVRYFIAEKYYSALNMDENRSLPLHYAALHGHFEVVKFLLECAPDTIDARNDDILTPLKSATLGNHLKIVEYLLKLSNLKIDFMMSFFGTVSYDFDIGNFLEFIAESGSLKVLEYMIDVYGCDPLIPTDPLGSTILNAAIRSGQLEVVKYLIEQKHAKFDNTKEIDKMSVQLAIMHSNFRTVKYLIDEHNCQLSKLQLQLCFIQASHGRDKDIINFFSK